MKEKTNQLEAIIPNLRMGVNGHERKFAIIFSMDNEDAASILAKVNHIQYIPGTKFVSVEDAARFFDLSYQYFEYMTLANGFTDTVMPEDVLVMTGKQLEAKMKNDGFMCTSCDKETYTVCNGDPENCKGIRLIKKQKTKMISARALLAIALKLSNAHKHHRDRAVQVVNAMDEAKIFEIKTKRIYRKRKPVAEEQAQVEQQLCIEDTAPAHTSDVEEQAIVAVTQAVSKFDDATLQASNVGNVCPENSRKDRQTIEMTSEMFQFVVRSIAIEAVRAAMAEMRLRDSAN